MGINFNVKSEPLSPKALGSEVKRIGAVQAKLRTRERVFLVVSTAVAAIAGTAAWSSSDRYGLGAAELALMVAGLAALVLAMAGAAEAAGAVVFAAAATVIVAVAWAMAKAESVAGEPWWALPEATVTELLVTMVAVVVVVGAANAYKVWIFAPRKAAARDLAKVDPIEPSHYPTVLAWCEHHAELATYQAAVAGQGRLLVKGEVEAMRAWIDETSARGR